MKKLIWTVVVRILFLITLAIIMLILFKNPKDSRKMAAIKDRKLIDETYKDCEVGTNKKEDKENACFFILSAKKYDTGDVHYKELNELADYIRELKKNKTL